MKRFRFSITSLLLVIFYVAVAVAALRASTDSWDTGVLGLTLVTLTTAVLLAVRHVDQRRAFWVGFALFGWAYFVASLEPWTRYRLPTTNLLARAEARLFLRQDLTFKWDAIPGPGRRGLTVRSVGTLPDGRVVVSTGDGHTMWHRDAETGKLLGWSSGTSEGFIRIGHSLLALLTAFAGGRLCRSLYSLGRRARHGDAVPDS